MNTQVSMSYERRKNILPIDFSDRRKIQRRINVGTVLHERRRLAAQIRQYERESIHIPVRLHIDCKETLGETQNISAGGLLIVINTFLPTGTNIRLQFSFGESVCYLSIIGQVVFCYSGNPNESTQYMIGIKFSAVHNFDQKILNTIIQALKQKVATDEKSSLNILVSQDTLAQEFSDLSSASSPSMFSKTENISTKKIIEDITFQRRKHPRYNVQLKGTLFVTTQDGQITEVPCEVRNLSRYGLCFKTGTCFVPTSDAKKMHLFLSNSSIATVQVKPLREEPFGEETIYSGEMSFPAEEVRRKIHTFLRTLGGDKLINRRGEERRKNSTDQEMERRQRDRRKNFGIFTECALFSSRIPNWRSTYTYYRHAESARPGHITIDGKELISFASKDYLGLAHDQRIKDAMINAIQKYGTTSWSRPLNGTISLLEELEEELARFKSVESALIFTGGYTANITILTALLKGKEDTVFLDEKVHASIVDGCLASGARMVVFKHNSVEDLKRKIEQAKSPRSLIIVDGVYSIEGDIAYLPEINAIAKKHQIPLMVDDAHGLGVMGTNGAGTAEHYGLNGQIEIEVGSFGASLAGVGGFIGCKKDVKDYLVHFSDGILYTTSLAPATVAGILAALRIVKTDPTLRAKLWSNVNQLKTGLKDLGYEISPSESAVMTITIGNERATDDTVRLLETHGIAVNTFRRPMVRRGTARLRMSVSAAHSESDIAKTLEAFKAIKPKLEREWQFCKIV